VTRRVAPLLLLLAGGLPGCTQRPPLPEAPNVVLITLDTLRADHLGCYGYFRDTSPRLDRFARECLLFERCLTPIATTFPSHISILTATYPDAHGIAGNVGDGGTAFEPTERLRSVAQILNDHDYATAAFISATPVKKYTGIDVGFDVFDAPGRGQRTAAATNEAVLPWLDERAAEPFFLWVHYFDPHSPYDPPARFRDRFREEELDAVLEERRVDAEKHFPDSPDLSVRKAMNLYDGEIRFLDDELGKLLDRLRGRADAWERTVVVIVGDHGEGLGQHDDMTHGGIWREQLHVPLLLRIPGERGRRIRDRVSTVDVLPMLLGLVDLPGEEEVFAQAGGVDRLAPDAPAAAIVSRESDDGHRVLDGQETPRMTILSGRWKLIHDPEGQDLLFDLEKDPFELASVHREQPDTVAALRSQLLRELERQEARHEVFYGDSAAGREVSVDEETQQQLRALGYTD
jgi:arylsulfatase A-like enzyme